MTHNVMGIDPCDGENYELFNTTSQKRTFVDARTGLFEVFVPLPTVLCNDGLGPAIDLSLAYTPMVNNTAGLGDGWSFAFTTYNEKNRQLRLHSGEAVHLPEDHEPLLSSSIIAYWDTGKTTLTVKRLQGNVEMLKRVGESSIFTPVRLSTDGKHFARLNWRPIAYNFDDGAQYQIRLMDIQDEAHSDKDGETVKHVEITYDESSFRAQTISIDFWKQVKSEACRYELTVKDYALVKVNEPEGLVHEFAYLDHDECGWLLNDVLAPSGLREQVSYDGTSVQFLRDSKLSKLPCVNVHTVTPASGSTPVVTEYNYFEKAILSADEDDDDFLDISKIGIGRGDLQLLAQKKLPGVTGENYRSLENELIKIRGALAYGQVSRELIRYMSKEGMLSLFQVPYETVVTCGARVERISYTADHQVSSVHVGDEGDYVSHKKYDMNQESISVFELGVSLVKKHGSIDSATVALLGMEQSVFSHGLLSERSNSAGQRRWTYDKPEHTTPSDGAGGYVFSPARITTEEMTYPDKTEGKDTFIYNGEDPRPAERQESLFNGGHLTHEYCYGDRGLTSVKTRQPVNAVIHEKNVLYTSTDVAMTQEVVEQVGSLKRSTRQTYSKFSGRVLGEVDADGNASEYTYDKQGRLLSHTTCATSKTHKATTQYSYPSVERMEVVEPNGLRRAYTYDGRGNVVREYLAPPARKDEKTAPWKLMLEETFDDRGRKSSTVRYDYVSTGGKEQTLAQRCTYSYDLRGTETQRTLDTGEVIVDYHEPFSNIRVERQGMSGGKDGKYSFYKKDSFLHAEINGEKIRGHIEGVLTSPNGTPFVDDLIYPHAVYSEVIDKIEWRDTTGKVVKVETFSYMRAGLVHQQFVVEQDQAFVVVFTYDGVNRCLSERYSYYTAEHFDEKDTIDERLNKLKNLVSSPSTSKLRQFKYPSDVFVTEPSCVMEDGQVVGEREFDALGRVVWISRNGFKETFTYEGAGSEPKTKTTADGKTLNYTYHKELGNRVASVEEATSKLKQTFTYATPSTSASEAVEGERRARFTYDSQGKVSSYEAQLRAEVGAAAKTAKRDAVKKTVTYTRSVAGRLLTEEDASGGRTEFSYDKYGRRSLASHVHAGSAEQSQLEFGYDASGHLASETLSLGKALGKNAKGTFAHAVKAVYEYEGQREVSRTFTTPQGVVKISRAYDPVGRLLETHIRQGDQDIGSRLLTYAVDGKLKQCVTTGVWRPTTLKNEAIDKQTFEYDKQGNLSQCVTSFGSKTCTSTFTYSGTRLLEVKHSEPSVGASAKLTYDTAGRVTKDQNGKTYDYDALGRLIKCGSKRYQYDAMNRLMANGTEKDQRQVIYDDLTVRGEYGVDTDEMCHCFLEGAGMAVMQRVKSGVKRTLVQLRDLAGTVLLTCDLVANTSLHHAYTAYGRGASTDEDALTGFNGEYRDADNDQYPLGNGYRWYAPDAMCFHRQDDASPFGEGGSNAYAYCDGDPVNKQDPTGNVEVFTAIVIIVSAFFITYMLTRVTTALFGEKASKIITTGLWAGIGVLTAIATGGLSLFAYAAVVALSVVAFATAIASVALDGIDDTASKILGWISLATTVAAGVVGAAAKAAGLAGKAMKELSTKLGKRADRCLNHLSHLRRASRYRPAMSASPRSAIAPTRSLQAGRGAGGGEDVLARMSDPAFRSQSKWYDSLRVFDSSDANTLVCTTTGVLGMTGVFESDNAADANGQLNNETWLPWGNWKGFMKTFTRRG